MLSSSASPIAAGNRRDFLKNAALAAAGLGAAAAGSAAGNPLAPFATRAAAAPFGAVRSDDPNAISLTRPRPAGNRDVYNLSTTPITDRKIRAAVIGLARGGGHVRDAVNSGLAEVVALCDVHKSKCEGHAKWLASRQAAKPEIFAGSRTVWEKLVERDDIDVVYIATPWEWHVPMALGALKHGKHAFIEVSAAVNIDECWQLVDASEKYEKHCVILENCCYGENELFVLNLVRQGVFGDLTHGECAYIHDLRGLLFGYGEGLWRREYHKTLDGNLYPTHGLGPIALDMDIARGDNFKFLVSVSSPELGLTRRRNLRHAKDKRFANEKYICGDMNTSIIKTESGRTIMVQHDVISPRPYSRINMLSGTGATFLDYPARLALDEPGKYGVKTGSHNFLNGDEMRKMRDQFTHPLIKQLREKSRGAGHGGMDFVMNYRLLDQLKRGVPLDLTVYDAALWSSLIELSAKSVATGSAPVAIPDFTRGAWKTNKPRL